jgi:hypothetical protein
VLLDYFVDERKKEKKQDCRCSPSSVGLVSG